MVVKRRRRATLLGALLIVMVVAVAAAMSGGYFIERWANARKDQAVAELQGQLGRPVKAGPIHVSWLGGFGVETGDVEIGAASVAEPGPALHVAKARLQVALWRALFSFGRRVHVKDVTLTGVTATVVRFPDGSINWRQINERLAASGDRPTKPTTPTSPATRARIRGITVAHAALADARVRFVDLARKGATAEVSDLDVTVDGAGFNDPFTAHLSAAVQSREKNLDLEAGFAATPASGDQLTPPPLRRVKVQLRPVDLAPLAPFLPAGPLAELTEGKLAADLAADLGAGVPGGQGPTTLKGEAHLTGARLAQGERFDGSLESDLLADLPRGDVIVRKLRVALGAMTLAARGKLLDLHGAPRFEGFAVTSNGLDFDVLRRYYPGLERAAGMTLGGPFIVAANADADGGAQRFAARIDLTQASLEAPGKLRKPAGTRLVLESVGHAEGQLVKFERVQFVMGDAHVDGQGTLHPARRGARPFEGTVEAEPFALRPVLALVHPQSLAGLPDLRVGFKARARGTLGHPESMHIEVPAFTAASGGSHVSGSFTVDNLDRPRVALDGKATYLDLDDFLPEHARNAPARTRARPSAGPEGPTLLSRVEGRAKLDVARGHAAGIDYQNLRADLALAGGRLRAHALEVAAFGGRFSGAGSELPLEGEGEPFIARGTIAAMDVSALLARFAPATKVLRGALSADIDLNGRGTTPGDLMRTLTGKLSGGVAGAEFLPGALLDPLVKSLSHAVKVPGLASMLAQADQRVAALRDRGLGDLAGVVRFADGVLEIAKPLEARAAYGALSLGGKVRLDGRADLVGTVAVSPEVASSLVGGRAAFSEPLPIKLRITGPLRAPRISPTELQTPARLLATAFARTAVAEGAREQVQKVTEKVTGKAAEGAKANVQEGVEKAKEAAGRRLRRLLPR
jgi:AsmA protein